jgi:hypothetical protein
LQRQLWERLFILTVPSARCLEPVSRSEAWLPFSTSKPQQLH